MDKQPLADRIRPQTLEEFVGQDHLVSLGKPLYQVIKNGVVSSMIFWGPPGVGKTTLARMIAQHINKPMREISGVSARKEDVREIVKEFQAIGGGILFLDEIHRFNKAQQDFLLPYVEDGTLILIGATTENPSFEVIPALLSRSRVYMLESLNDAQIQEVIQRGAVELGVRLDQDALDYLVAFANGDGRQSLNLLDSTVNLYGDEAGGQLTLEHFKNALQSKHIRYDKASEEHYNTISAYIKSMRASDVDASLYYLARMVHAGEDPKFIARRMVIFASEDIGMALPTALVVANEVFKAVETIGYPECQINLAHGTVYLASAPKDRSAYEAYFEALDDVAKRGNLPIPLHLRNAPTKLMKDVGYGKGYEMYSQDSLLPEALKNKRYYKKKS
jgi:putative ATPase